MQIFIYAMFNIRISQPILRRLLAAVLFAAIDSGCSREWKISNLLERAAELGISRLTPYELMEKLGIAK